MTEPETDPGHYLPQADWDSVVAEAERIRTERSEAARLTRIKLLMGGNASIQGDANES